MTADPDPERAGPDREWDRLLEARDAVRNRTDLEPTEGLVLGTGLALPEASVEIESTIDVSEIPGFPVPTESSHRGALILGSIGPRRVAILQGRPHHYEGYSLREVVFPVRLLRLLGARTLVTSGIAGGLDPLWRLGELVLLDDHINLMGRNPLVGPNIDQLGPRFPDMSEPYDRDLQEQLHGVAVENRITVQRGIYAAVTGPNLETRAEYRMLRMLGADMVGMSTVPEVIAARHAGMRVLALSVITDLCLPDALEEIDVEQIMQVAAAARPPLATLITGFLGRLEQ